MMKKFPVIILMMGMLFHASAQEDHSGVRFGLTLSPQLSWMPAGDNNIEGNGTAFGFSYGLLMDFLIPKNYAFATGIIISSDGGGLSYLQPTAFNTFGKDSVFAAGTNVDYRLQYIVIPLSIKLRTNQIGYITYFGQFGLRGGINVRSRANLTNLAGNTLDEKINFGEDVTPFDLGLLVGGGFEYEITGNTALHVALQYYNGFIDVTDNPAGYKSKATLNHLRLQLGVFF
jgi:hypothetical protein